MRKFSNRKLNKIKVFGLASILIASGLSVSCKAITTKTAYEFNRIEVTNDGILSEARQFKPFSENQNALSNSFIYYDKWEQREDQKYSRLVKEYNVKYKSYEDIKELVSNNSLDVEEVLGKPIKIYTQITDFVEEDELERKAHFEATFYSKNEKRSVTIETENPESKNALILGAAGVALGTGALIGWNIYDKKLTLKRRDN